jgi:putative chitinase
MNRAAFYAALRKRGSGVFGTALSQGQVDGMENLLDVWQAHFSTGPLDELAYDLGTAYHETAHTMQPITERGPKSYFNKYEPGTKIGKVLGNTQPGDGYRYRGEGHVQNTGRANAGKASRRLNEVFGLQLDLVANPAQRGDPRVSALSLFLGNREGWWTGKGLLSYLDGIDEADDEDVKEFVNARRVVNGTDKAATIAGYALAFEQALKAAGYAPAAPKPHPIPAQPLPEPTNGKSGFGWLVAAIIILAAVAAAFLVRF